MTTQISTKLAALAVALMMNGLLIGGVAYLFDGQLHQATTITAAGGHGAAHSAAVAVLFKAI